MRQLARAQAAQSERALRAWAAAVARRRRWKRVVGGGLRRGRERALRGVVVTWRQIATASTWHRLLQSRAIARARWHALRQQLAATRAWAVFATIKRERREALLPLMRKVRAEFLLRGAVRVWAETAAAAAQRSKADAHRAEGAREAAREAADGAQLLASALAHATEDRHQRQVAWRASQTATRVRTNTMRRAVHAWSERRAAKYRQV
jgi:hypothetical protein